MYYRLQDHLTATTLHDLRSYFVNSTSHQSLNKENNNKDYKEVKFFAATTIWFWKWNHPKELVFDYTQPDLYHQPWCGNCATYNIHGGSCELSRKDWASFCTESENKQDLREWKAANNYWSKKYLLAVLNTLSVLCSHIIALRGLNQYLHACFVSVPVKVLHS